MRYLFIFVILLGLLVRRGTSINCYTCVSRNNDNSACENGYSSAGFTKDCRMENGQHGNYCIKIEGQGMNTGGSVVIRGCSAQQWNAISTAEQPIQYSTFNIVGRVTSCDEDYCNSSSLPGPRFMILAVFASMALFFSSSSKWMH